MLAPYWRGFYCEVLATCHALGLAFPETQLKYREQTRRYHERIRAAVDECPGLTARELVRRIDHHYVSEHCARVVLLDAVHDSMIPGVELRGSGGMACPYRFVPSEWQGPLASRALLREIMARRSLDVS